MAPLTKLARIHDDILDYMIMPRLPFKTLTRFQSIAKRYRSLIRHDTLFASQQAKLLSPSTSVPMRYYDKILSFPTNPESVGVPDPSLKFLGNAHAAQPGKLLCSTNGLLLFSCCDHCQGGVYVCNPATQEKVFVPTHQYTNCTHMGLAYDPSVSPNRFNLVNKILAYAMDNHAYYRFDVFRSDTGEWSSSKKRVYVTYPYQSSAKMVLVHTKGVIYWQFYGYILWYNIEKDLAGSVPMPRGIWSVNVYAGWVVCCRGKFNSGVLEVWRLANGTRLDRLHCFNWDCIAMPLDLYHMKRSCFKDVDEFDNSPSFYPPSTWLKWHVPLAFDGQFVYLRDSLQSGFLWGYNICTQQLEKKGMNAKNLFKLLDYHNSMAPVPRILERATNQKI